MESQMVMDFISQTGANPNDALSCLKAWGWDLKKALIDYNGILITFECFFHFDALTLYFFICRHIN